MLKLYTYILLMFCCATAVAQNNFHKTYDYQNRSDGGYEIIESNNDFVVFGFTSSGGFTSKFLKIDSVGNTIFHKGYEIRFDDIRGGAVV